LSVFQTDVIAATISVINALSDYANGSPVLASNKKINQIPLTALSADAASVPHA
jgi:hypothetical protein